MEYTEIWKKQVEGNELEELVQTLRREGLGRHLHLRIPRLVVSPRDAQARALLQATLPSAGTTPATAPCSPHFPTSSSPSSSSTFIRTTPRPTSNPSPPPEPSPPTCPSIRHSACRIVYVCRNPLDQLVSEWYFIGTLRRAGVEPQPFDQMSDTWCKGMNNFGPFWGHVMFMKYEDMKEDIKTHIKKLAVFLGCHSLRMKKREGWWMT